MLTEFEQQILSAIQSLGDNAYGVPIAEAVEKARGKRVSVGTLYLSLSMLQDRGLVRSWEGEKTPERGNRAKKYFALEQAGKDALER